MTVVGALGRSAALRFAKRGHSAQWIQRHIKDRWVQRAHQDMYRSRSAFKLKQLDQEFSFLRRKSIVLDLGCYPGGWSQIALERTWADKSRGGSSVIGVDKLAMEPLEYHTFIRGDVGEALTLNKVREALQGRQADVVVSDMAPGMTGSRGDDHISSVELCRLGLRFAEAVLKEGGWFITKVFDGYMMNSFREDLTARFGKVRNAKPNACRPESKELYLVCSKYFGSMHEPTDVSLRVNDQGLVSADLRQQNRRAGAGDVDGERLGLDAQRR
eukprot:TRINITY_DN37438_c0_g1_i1.p1 TRINITY_DN37438_c0_g1~~TRINITY_DN37438_c0_g1_i1.p1  ORF type:complete len:272 (-),score=34.84 TRINITY_DN37438_c0_g1_i1:127-942(-)